MERPCAATPQPRHVPPEHGCASCGILWDDEVIRRNHARGRVKMPHPLGIHPAYSSPDVALCGICLRRLHKFWIDTGEQPTCPQEANALALYRGSLRSPCASSRAQAVDGGGERAGPRKADKRKWA